MGDLLNKAIAGVETSTAAFYRYITANDTGTTGAHQAGFYIPKCASALLFNTPGVRGENKDKLVKIRWQDEFETSSRFIYYGKATRNEYRITRFGKNFPFFEDDNIGDLLIIAKQDENEYYGFVLHSDEDIDGFLSHFNLTPNTSNKLIEIEKVLDPQAEITRLFEQFTTKFDSFPETKIMAEGARSCHNQAYQIAENALTTQPDEILLKWIDSEFALFRSFEDKFYKHICTTPFTNIESFIKTANEVLNRRKSRAGKSLEHHLAQIFKSNQLEFEAQAITENNKQPDFLFPNAECYHNLLFPANDLTVLGAKTTCKDRWRQIISEADRVETKYLFTLQQGVSKNQLKEMEDANVKLVVPTQYISCFPTEYKDSISNLKGFIAMVREKQARIPKSYFISHR